MANPTPARGWRRALKDNVGKGLQYVTDFANKVSGGKIPNWQQLTPFDAPIEQQLQDRNVTSAIRNYVKTLQQVEKQWAAFGTEYDNLIANYSFAKKGPDMIAASFYRSDALLNKEYAKVKYGTHVSLEDVEEKERAEREKRTEEAKSKGEEEPAIVLGLKDVPTALQGQEIDRASAENHTMRIYMPNLKDEFKGDPNRVRESKIEFEYGVPKAGKLRYWHNLMSDKNDILNEWDYSYFGHSMRTTWEKHYESVIEKVCDAAKEHMRATNIPENVEMSQQEQDIVVRNIDTIGDKYRTAIENFMEKIQTFEGKQYSYLRKVGNNAIALDDRANSFEGEKLPRATIKGIATKEAGIYYQHTYRIIDPERLVDQWKWNTVHGMFSLLLSILGKLLGPDDPGKGLLREKEQRLGEVYEEYPWMRQFWVTYRHDPSKVNHLRVFYLPKDEKRGLYDERTELGMADIVKQVGEVEEDDEDIVNFLREIFKKWNLELFTRSNGKDKAQAYFMDDLPGLTFQTDYKNGERAPGWDNSGWPLEISGGAQGGKDDGSFTFRNRVTDNTHSGEGLILLDLYDEHKREARGGAGEGIPVIRKVSMDFVDDLDLLFFCACVHNEWDAIRDDIRDGRYHPGSLTVTEYLLAMKRSVADDPLAQIHDKWSKEMGNVYRIGEQLLEKKSLETINISPSSIHIDKLTDGEAAQLQMELDNNPTGPWNFTIGQVTGANLTELFSNPRFYRMRKYIRNSTGGASLGNMNNPKQSEWGIRRPGNLNPSYDGNALGKPWWHLGRKRYHDPAEMILAELDATEYEKLTDAEIIGPALSTRGLSIYVIEKVLLSVSHYEDAKGIMKKIIGDQWYDYGPRDFNKYGSQNPLELDADPQISSANTSVEAARHKEMPDGSQAPDESNG